MCWKHGKVTERPCFAEAFAEAVSNVSKAMPQTSQNFDGLNIHDKIGDGVLLTVALLIWHFLPVLNQATL